MPQSPTHAFPWRNLGVWLTVLIVLMMAFNAWQAFANPAAFASRFGLVGAADADAGFVRVYGARALFLALVPAVLLRLREYRALGWFAGVAVVMPVADAMLVSAAGGPSDIVARHIIIAVYLVVTAWLLLRLAAAHGRGA